MSTNPAPERQLVDQCLAGDGEARQALCVRFRKVVLRAITAWLGRRRGMPALAEDLCQDLWHRLIKSGFRQLRTFDPELGNLEAFMVRLGQRQVLSWQAGRNWLQRHEVPLDGHQPPDREVLVALPAFAMKELEALLPPKLRQLLASMLAGEERVSATGPNSVAARKRKERLIIRVLAFFRENDN